MNWVSSDDLQLEGHLLGLPTFCRAVLRENDLRVVLKCIQYPLDHPRDRLAFVARVASFRNVDHPALLRVVGYGRFSSDYEGVTKGTAFVMYEDVDIGNLRQLPGVRTWPRARATILSLLDGLVHLHGAGFVHGGLDPSKVFFRTTSEGVQTCITHSGCPEDYEPHFVAPERMTQPDVPQSPLEDLFAVGRICEEMLEVRTPDEHASYWSDRDLPHRLARWIGRMVAVNPADRFGSAWVALQEFRRLVDLRPSQTVLARTPSADLIETPDPRVLALTQLGEDVRRDGVTRFVGVKGASRLEIANLKRHLLQRYVAEVHEIEDHPMGARFGLRPRWFETPQGSMHTDAFVHRQVCQRLIDRGSGALQVVFAFNVEGNLFVARWLEVLRESGARCLVILFRTRTRQPTSGVRTDLELDFENRWDDEIEARLDEVERATPVGYEALELAATLGPQVADLKWEMACSAAGLEVNLPTLETVVWSGLLTRLDQGWVLELLGAEALHRRIEAEDRQERWNEVALKVVQEARGLDPVVQGFRSAHHAFAAGRTEDGLRWAEETVEELLRQRRDLEATQLVRLALDVRRDGGLGDPGLQVRLWTLLGRALLRRDPASAVWWLRRATEVATQIGSNDLWMGAVPYLMAASRLVGVPEKEAIRKEVAIRVVRGEAMRLRPQAALQLAREMTDVSKMRLASRLLELYEPRLTAGPEYAEMLYLRGKLALFFEEFVLAAELADVSQSEADAVGDSLTYAEAAALSARAAYRLGESERAVRLYARAASLLEESGADMLTTYFRLAVIASQQGHVEQARRWTSQLMSRASESQMPRARLLEAISRLWMSAFHGAVAEAQAWMVEVDARSREIEIQEFDVAGVIESAARRLELVDARIGRECFTLAGRFYRMIGDTRRAEKLTRRT